MSDKAVYSRRAQCRGGVIVTGTEVLTGHIVDRNGPWLSARLSELGVELSMIAIVGDRPGDLHRALVDMANDGLSVIVTSGGLGPTADDLTAEVVAEFAGRDMVVEPRLEADIARVLGRNRRGGGEHVGSLVPIDAAQRAGIRKQARVPRGASVLEPQGTAPGLIVPVDDRDGLIVVVLPGPPSELQGMWPDVLAAPLFLAAIESAEPIDERMLRLYGVSEAEIAETLQEADRAGIALGELEVTTCLRDGELEVSTRVTRGHEAAYEELASLICARHGAAVFSRDGRTIDEQVAALLLDGDGQTIALAESCTGGMLAARLTERAGASAYLLGGAVVYSNAAKSELVGVDPELIERFGAVSAEVADALAVGALRRFGASVGVGITGIAGPGGGSVEKPVGTVCLAVAQVRGEDHFIIRKIIRVPGPRDVVRQRATTAAMHMLKELLS